jgi:hypothetical protein
LDGARGYLPRADEMSRFLIVIVALFVAIAAALVFLPIAALIDPIARSAGADLTIATLLAMLDGELSDRATAGHTLMTILQMIRSVTAIICVLPIVVIGLIGEIAGVASWVWYCVATGFVSAVFPFLLRAKTSGQQTLSPILSPVEGRFALILFLTGVVSGFIYWLLAGRTVRLNFDGSRRRQQSV